MKRIFVAIDYGFNGGNKTEVIEVPDDYNDKMIDSVVEDMIDRSITYDWEDITVRGEE